MRLTDKKIDELRKNKNWRRWLDCYARVGLYAEKYGRFPRSVDEFPAGCKLGRWYNEGIRISYRKGRLKLWQVHLLNKFNYVFDVPDRWGLNFNALKKGWDEHPESWPYVHYYTPHLKRIERWCTNQRKLYAEHTLAPDRIKKLDSIHFAWDLPGDVVWMGHYDRLVQWVKKHGRLPKRYSNNAQERFLMHWVTKERYLLKRGMLDERRAEKLALFFRKTGYDPVKFGWEESCGLYKSWYAEHGKRPKKYATNGRERRLGAWIVVQNGRMNRQRLSKEQAAALIQLKKQVGYVDKKQ